MAQKNIHLVLLRLDELHEEWGGNKFFKLKYNLEKARADGYTKLLSFGGAYSNHLYALAAYGRHEGFETIGLVRGEFNGSYNPTLEFARTKGMQLEFISREAYRKKTTADFISSLKQKYGEFYLIPEGGSNDLAVKGCSEISSMLPIDCDFICAAVGTGASLAGIITGMKAHQKAIGFSSLKGGQFLQEAIENFCQPIGHFATKCELISDYHFGGYGKINQELMAFKKDFHVQHAVELDYVYTGKMMYGIFDLIRKDYFKSGSRIVAVHSGGVQGNKGFES